jgi:cytosine deaminase
MQFPESHYWLKNAHVPQALIQSAEPVWSVSNPAAARENLAWVDLEIQDGKIRSLHPGGTADSGETPAFDLKRGIVFPCFVDLHAHLDKGHSWGRSPNRSGSFEEALTLANRDREKYWHAEDVYRRMAFAAKCSYAHGTRAIRTHIDSFGEQAAVSLSALKALQQEWDDSQGTQSPRLTIQAVPLVPLDYFLTSEGEALADLIAEQRGSLGGLSLMSDQLKLQLDRVFTLAKDRQLTLDFHVDESGDPGAMTLRQIAAATIRHGYHGKVICGHCCSLAVQPARDVLQTLALIKAAGIGVVSLPMCNLYLQDRQQQASQNFLQADSGEPLSFAKHNFPTHTPRWRGVTLLHELKHTGVPVAVASDNCRDPFHAFGDHDMLEVLTQATRIAHLDSPYADWCRAVTWTPADLMGLPTAGRIAVGLPADLVLFKARYYSELLARRQADRTVLRNGRAIDTTLPDYAELDDLYDDYRIGTGDLSSARSHVI